MNNNSSQFPKHLNIIVGCIVILGLYAGQFWIESDSVPERLIYPLKGFNLFSELPLKKQHTFLYLEHQGTEEKCYYSSCPVFDYRKHEVWRFFHYTIIPNFDRLKYAKLITTRLNLKNTPYKPIFINELTTYREKWKELSVLMTKRR